jgi:hypothetical protein
LRYRAVFCSLTKDEARRIAANIAKLTEMLKRSQYLVFFHAPAPTWIMTRSAQQIRQLGNVDRNRPRLVASEQIGDGNLASPYFLSHFFSMMRVSPFVVPRRRPATLATGRRCSEDSGEKSAAPTVPPQPPDRNGAQISGLIVRPREGPSWPQSMNISNLRSNVSAGLLGRRPKISGPPSSKLLGRGRWPLRGSGAL